MVKYVSNNKKKNNKRHRIHWRLMKRGHSLSHGKTTLHRLNRVLRHLHSGTYVLHVGGQKVRIVVPAHKTHGGHRHG